MPPRALTVTPTDAAIGAVVEGVALNHPPDPETRDALEAAVERHGVLIFPEQSITPAEQVAFSRTFGPLEINATIDARLPEAPEVLVIGNTGKRPITFAPKEGSDDLEWHADHIHRKETARASLLYGLDVPPEGGDTLFACMYGAYDALTPAEKAECETLEVIHSVAGLRAFVRENADQYDYEDGAHDPLPDAVTWPLVRRHPRSGRPALYFGAKISVGIVGWPDEKGRRFIQDLTAHATRERFRYRHRWRKHDVLLWDNRRVLHAATPFDMAAHTRRLHRTTLRETEAVR